MNHKANSSPLKLSQFVSEAVLAKEEKKRGASAGSNRPYTGITTLNCAFLVQQLKGKHSDNGSVTSCLHVRECCRRKHGTCGNQIMQATTAMLRSFSPPSSRRHKCLHQQRHVFGLNAAGGCALDGMYVRSQVRSLLV